MEHGKLASGYTTEEKLPVSLSSHQLPIGPQLGLGMQEPFSHPRY